MVEDGWLMVLELEPVTHCSLCCELFLSDGLHQEAASVMVVSTLPQ
jgi:hypothetical protein